MPSAYDRATTGLPCLNCSSRYWRRLPTASTQRYGSSYMARHLDIKEWFQCCLRRNPDSRFRNEFHHRIQVRFTIDAARRRIELSSTGQQPERLNRGVFLGQFAERMGAPTVEIMQDPSDRRRPRP